MTQRILTTTPALLPRATAASRPQARWVSLGEAIGALLESLFGWTAPRADALPPQILRDHDPALHRALREVGLEHERERLTAGRQTLLY